MRVQIQALSAPGFSGLFRARRFWPSETATEIEVIDKDDDPPDTEVEILDPQTQQRIKRMVPDPKRIGRRSYEQIRKDPRLRVLQDGETDGRLSQKAFDEAVRTAGEATSALAAVRAQVVSLTEELAAVKLERDELQAKVADLQETIAAVMEQSKAESPKPEEPKAPKAKGK